MDNKRLEDKIDKLDGRLDKIDIKQAEMNQDLKYHIKRTDLIEAELRPIKKHVDIMNLLAKISSVVLSLVLAAKSLGLF